MPTTMPPRAMAWARAGRALLASGAEIWARSWEIGLRHTRQRFAAPPGTSDHRRQLVPPVRSLFDAYRHYAMEMASVPWLALERFGADMSGVPDAPARRTAGVGGKSIPLPLRVHEAIQGIAVYAVPERIAEQVLKERRVPFVPVRLGLGWTACVITTVRYLTSDLGTYDEIGVALLVAPDRASLVPGLFFIELPVNSEFARDAGRRIWGYPKTDGIIDVAISKGRASWTLRRSGGPEVLTIRFPRGGGGTSMAIPVRTYTVLGRRPHRTTFVRTGRGERLRAGGAQVTLTLGPARHDPLWRVLHRLGLPSAPRLLQGWTEHVSGELRAPVPLIQG